jgi:hypothetical protein
MSKHLNRLALIGLGATLLGTMLQTSLVIGDW